MTRRFTPSICLRGLLVLEIACGAVGDERERAIFGGIVAKAVAARVDEQLDGFTVVDCERCGGELAAL